MILDFSHAHATQLSNSGGKGASLAKLFQDGFAVPPGVIIPASAYAEFVFIDTLWPDFGPDEFRAAIEDYASRRRRFGGR